PAVVGQSGRLELAVETPGGALNRLDVSLEQDGLSMPLYSLATNGEDGLVRADDDRVVLARPLGKRQVPELKAGPATIRVAAARPVLFGYREAASETVHELE